MFIDFACAVFACVLELLTVRLLKVVVGSVGGIVGESVVVVVRGVRGGVSAFIEEPYKGGGLADPFVSFG